MAEAGEHRAGVAQGLGPVGGAEPRAEDRQRGAEPGPAVVERVGGVLQVPLQPPVVLARTGAQRLVGRSHPHEEIAVDADEVHTCLGRERHRPVDARVQVEQVTFGELRHEYPVVADE